jgi:hypothetical protein
MTTECERDGTGDCRTCPYWRSLLNRQRGVRIPHPTRPGRAWGKCTRKEGHCQPQNVRGR